MVQVRVSERDRMGNLEWGRLVVFWAFQVERETGSGTQH